VAGIYEDGVMTDCKIIKFSSKILHHFG